MSSGFMQWVAACYNKQKQAHSRIKGEEGTIWYELGKWSNFDLQDLFVSGTAKPFWDLVLVLAPLAW